MNYYALLLILLRSEEMNFPVLNVTWANVIVLPFSKYSLGGPSKFPSINSPSISIYQNLTHERSALIHHIVFWKIILQYTSKVLNINIPSDPTVPFLGINPKKVKMSA